MGKQGGDTRGSVIHHALRQSGSRVVKDKGVGWYQLSSPYNRISRVLKVLYEIEV